MEDKKQSLIIENKELKSRLLKLEESLNAIQAGKADAIFLEGNDGGKVFSLKSTETPYRIIIENMNDGAVTLLSDGTIIYCNNQFAELTHLPLERIIGLNFSHLVANEDKHKFEILFKNGLTYKDAGEITYVTPGGNCKHFMLSISPMPSELEGATCIIVRDISKLKKVENDLRNSQKLLEEENFRLIKTKEEIKYQNERLQKLAKEKDKFFSVISHDLKNPFNSILGFSENLLELVNENDYTHEDIKKRANIILKSSQQAYNLLLNLMEWAYTETGRITYEPEYFDLVELISETELLFLNMAKQKSIKIMPYLPSEMQVYADKDMVGSVLRNLISNAIKFSNQNGSIQICAQEAEKELIVSVIDSGIGMPQENTDKIFENEINFSTPGTCNERGTGLGLILCKEFIESHGGRIWVETQEGKGFSVYFSIPLFSN